MKDSLRSNMIPRNWRCVVLMVHLALARMILKFCMFVEVGEVLTLLSAFRGVFLASLHSSLNQILLCLTTLGLLFGILLLAIFIRMFVKFPTASSGSRIDSYFKSDAALSEKAFQLALESFPLQFVSKVEALLQYIAIGK